jgi:peptidoglycan/LPS O-acetylase OafA/YrhL
MQYRREIDGLRAVAVMPVILFHAGLGLFSGGYVGVDVFFVISGYLITTILLEERAAGRYSLAGFYERRARRILPALFFVCAATLPFAWAWMLPSELAEYGRSLAAVMLFVSNIHFLDQAGGYFSPDLELQPLLHTWSLAVEEQYYLLLPLVLMAFRRLRMLGIVLGLMGVASLALADWGAWAEPEKNFFFTFSRLWELFAGSLVAVWLRARGGVAPNGALAALGLAMILGAMLAYDSATPFPSRYTVLPVAGTVLVLLFAGQGTMAGRLLGMRALVGIGLISYSAYLWHQPVLAFARIRLIDHPPAVVMAGLVVLSLVLAAATYALVEQPFRRRGGAALLPRRAGVFTASGLGMAALIAGGLWLERGAGMPGRLADSAAFALVSETGARNLAHMAECHLDGTAGSYPGLSLPACNTGGAGPLDAIMIGDSHASALRAALFEATANSDAGDLNIGTIAFGACPPVPGLRSERDTDCPMLTERLYADLAASDIPVVVFVARWSLYSTGTGFDNGEGGRETKLLPYAADGFDRAREDGVLAAYGAAIARLRDAGKRVVVVHPVPEAGWNVAHRLIRIERFGGVPLEDIAFGADPSRVQARHAPVTTALDAVADVIAVRPSERLCDTVLPGRCVHAARGRTYYDDDDHLSIEGARLVVPPILAAVRSALTTR